MLKGENVLAQRKRGRVMHVSERYFPIGENLYRLRRERALTQKQLAERAGVHHITVSDLERGAQEASPETVQRLAAALGVEVQRLIGSPGEA
jgi:transcriptional regulator with XRE-family HTH domain